ncbi:tRNA glutamyl-Q(34) synthetase GluQRS [Marinibactrum halimedae]|uniref:tRNA glutamyl-Q(34) synthetase GluQRS n=1 Tax=Marinibactrum halimedae TaxID=1444977 RepID=UPI001E34B423|nr:tRNA glutamyl-Q(34) synthetase GluQRS [Marinibactrum halimedae]MCD9458988.1 tRNA glutamyl-Q(34) synthetase GluQRS [Marinibactrum halimedae]
MDTPNIPNTYRGRFAPSPTGPLHFGSLVSAIASYLEARHHHGRWLVRIEDLDPPREQPGAAEAIISTLEAHGLVSDEAVLYQSERYEIYNKALSILEHQGATYPCTCTRPRLKSLGNVYDGHCAIHPPQDNEPAAIRLSVQQADAFLLFNDTIQGEQSQPLKHDGDFIIHRKDGLYAYQLAVVVDDIAQNITHVLRGSDLLPTTARQWWVYQHLSANAPLFGHLPVVTNPLGQKLSKQNKAPAIDSNQASLNWWHALTFLGQAPQENLKQSPLTEIMTWAKQHWRTERIPQQLGLGYTGIATLQSN